LEASAWEDWTLGCSNKMNGVTVFFVFAAKAVVLSLGFIFGVGSAQDFL